MAAALVLAWSLAMAPPVAAESTAATVEAQTEGPTDPGIIGTGGTEGAIDDITGGATNGAADKAPRDPNKGAVTSLPIPRFVSLKGSEGNARRGPGLTHRIDWVFTRAGMPLKITAEYEHWRRVEDIDGAGGWVNFVLLSGVRTVLVTQDMAEAHASPDNASQVYYQSELGVIGKLLECVPDWCRIAVEGEKGWVRKTALWGVDKDEIFP